MLGAQEEKLNNQEVAAQAAAAAAAATSSSSKSVALDKELSVDTTSPPPGSPQDKNIYQPSTSDKLVSKTSPLLSSDMDSS